MIERRKEELALIRAQYGEIEYDDNLDWVLIKAWKLPAGWNEEEVSVLVKIPPGYPVTPPDNFYTDNDLRLANGKQPSNSTVNQTQLGRQWLQFSFHVEGGDWHPKADLLAGHNLQTFITGIAKRFSEVV